VLISSERGEMEELEELFEEWEGEYRRNGIEEPFVRDGVVAPEKYENIVWILKDTNDYSKPINELVANVVKTRRKTPMWRGAMWHNLGRVTGKLLNPSISFREAHRRRKEFLLNIAIFNLKKIPGKDFIDEKDLWPFVEGYQKFILRELELLNPKKVVLGGTFQFVKDIFQLEREERNRFRSSLFPGVQFFKLYHPAFQIKRESYFNQVQ
jgi:hypothetical protein